MHKNYYNILGIDSSATEDEIRRAYFKLSLKYHPDKCNGRDEEFKKINNAYQILKNNKNNQLYFYNYFNFIYILIYLYINQNKNLKLDLDITLDELYTGKVKKIVVNVKRQDIFKKINIYISLLNYENKYLLKKLGDNNLSDIEININILEHSIIKIDNVLNKFDLYIDKDINLYEYYYGLKETLLYLYDEKIDLDLDFRNGLTHIIKNKGLPYYTDELKRGNLYIYFKIRYPLHKQLPLKNIKHIIYKLFKD
jgi:DnaJ-class molecular chaperone